MLVACLFFLYCLQNFVNVFEYKLRLKIISGLIRFIRITGWNWILPVAATSILRGWHSSKGSNQSKQGQEIGSNFWPIVWLLVQSGRFSMYLYLAILYFSLSFGLHLSNPFYLFWITKPMLNCIISKGWFSFTGRIYSAFSSK